ncbi:MAG: proline--tRNA ligase, partial [Promicromonosporaceae bacterium]|nr:proline--tRNA ligase [Promicromonosporaceae bacterium]
MDKIAQEVLFPALLPREPYEITNRWSEYGPNLFRVKDRKGADYLLAPTHEEMFTLIVKDLFSSYKDLPLSLYQIQTKYRDEARPRAGLIRGREFVMKDSYSFDIDDAGLDASYLAHREAYERIFQRLGLDYVIVSAMSGAMGGSRSEEFLVPSPIGEDTFVKSEGGYAANVEAVTTMTPQPLDDAELESLPTAELRPTPGVSSIADLVQFANASYPRADRDWVAGDMLKHLVYLVKDPRVVDESGVPVEFPVVVAIPGDREVDTKRLEAAFEPAVVRVAEDTDFAKYPSLVKGFIGPSAVGPQGPTRGGTTASNSGSAGPRDLTSNQKGSGANTGQSAIPYYVDPRVVVGTTWITGGDQIDHHQFGMVMGRDFAVDATIEAAEIRTGDPAPDGSGPLELARGIEMGHIFQLGRKYAEALGLKVLDENGKTQTVTMGSYGIGVTRALAALAEANFDDRGLAWPAHLAPVQVHLVATGKGQEVFAAAEQLATDLTAAGLDVIYDDRPKVSPGVKFADAELLGAPVIVVVGRGLKDGLIEVRPRAGAGSEVALAEVLPAVQALLTGR